MRNRRLGFVVVESGARLVVFNPVARSWVENKEFCVLVRGFVGRELKRFEELVAFERAPGSSTLLFYKLG